MIRSAAIVVRLSVDRFICSIRPHGQLHRELGRLISGMRCEDETVRRVRPDGSTHIEINSNWLSVAAIPHACPTASPPISAIALKGTSRRRCRQVCSPALDQSATDDPNARGASASVADAPRVPVVDRDLPNLHPYNVHDAAGCANRRGPQRCSRRESRRAANAADVRDGLFRAKRAISPASSAASTRSSRGPGAVG